MKPTGIGRKIELAAGAPVSPQELTAGDVRARVAELLAKPV